jgi:hypothetical protein
VRRHYALGAFAVSPALACSAMSPVIKGPGFHEYADGRYWLGIPHAGDVLSNLPFVIVGIMGLVAAREVTAVPRRLVQLFFLAILGIGLGSGAYHVHPIDATLAFDWLPIVVALAWLTALVVSDRVDARAGRVAAFVLPALAIGSVLWWWAGGGTAGGDMRWYAMLQLLFVAIVPVVLVLYPKGTLSRGDLLLGVGCFVGARVLHANDAAILEATGVSGHTLKHLAAGVAAYFVLRAVRRARPVETPAPASG